MNRLGKAILEARLKAKLTPKELAKKCGLTESYILQVESGKKIVNEGAAEKILNALGQNYESVEPQVIEEKEPPIKPLVMIKERPEPTVSVNPNAQWRDALAGVIRQYPVMRGDKVVGYQDLVIANKKIEGVHPDQLMIVECQENNPTYRMMAGDHLYIAKEEKQGKDMRLINDKIYLISYFNKQMVRKIRLESNGLLTISPGLSGGSREQVSQTQIVIMGRVVKVSFAIQ